MVGRFNAEEVLEMASQIERDGASFYRRAAALTNNSEVSRLFSKLATMEESHEIIFENMRAEPDVLAQLLGDPDSDAALYLRALAGGSVFPLMRETESVLSPDISLEETLRLAINLELVSIAFYQGIRRGMKEEGALAKVDAIIAEEMQHVTLLSSYVTPLDVKR
jgi:rubrerythrin